MHLPELGADGVVDLGVRPVGAAHVGAHGDRVLVAARDRRDGEVQVPPVLRLRRDERLDRALPRVDRLAGRRLG